MENGKKHPTNFVEFRLFFGCTENLHLQVRAAQWTQGLNALQSLCGALLEPDVTTQAVIVMSDLGRSLGNRSLKSMEIPIQRNQDEQRLHFDKYCPFSVFRAKSLHSALWVPGQIDDFMAELGAKGRQVSLVAGGGWLRLGAVFFANSSHWRIYIHFCRNKNSKNSDCYRLPTGGGSKGEGNWELWEVSYKSLGESEETIGKIGDPPSTPLKNPIR